MNAKRPRAPQRTCAYCGIVPVSRAGIFCRTCGRARDLARKREAKRAWRLAHPTPPPAVGAPDTRRFERACPNCGAAFVGRARFCPECHEVADRNAGHLSCPVIYCVDCGWSLGDVGTALHTRRCAKCQDLRQWDLHGIDHVLNSARYWEHVNADAIEEDRASVARVLTEVEAFAPGAPAPRSLEPCPACGRPAISGVGFCYDDRLLDSSSAIVERQIDHQLARVVGFAALAELRDDRHAEREARAATADRAERRVLAALEALGDVSHMPSVAALLAALRAKYGWIGQFGAPAEPSHSEGQVGR